MTYKDKFLETGRNRSKGCRCCRKITATSQIEEAEQLKSALFERLKHLENCSKKVKDERERLGNLVWKERENVEAGMMENIQEEFVFCPPLAEKYTESDMCPDSDLLFHNRR